MEETTLYDSGIGKAVEVSKIQNRISWPVSWSYCNIIISTEKKEKKMG